MPIGQTTSANVPLVRAANEIARSPVPNRRAISLAAPQPLHLDSLVPGDGIECVTDQLFVAIVIFVVDVPA
jgi:hypothetical protein